MQALRFTTRGARDPAQAGVGDLSVFNCAFRRRFGATPSDVRHGAVGNVT